nr:peroxisomal (S)-2-hydroxy-acid oxidase GLO4-like [Tanacetum cinerariifolium]
MSTCTIEEVASSCNAVRVFQLYILNRLGISALMVKRAETNGFKAILVTVDTPRLGRREDDIKNKMIAPQLKNFEGLVSTIDDTDGSKLAALASSNADASFSWKDISWLKSITKSPILIKGVLTREDAIKAVEVGVEGIKVSNHGGRQLNAVSATIDALEDVVLAVQGRIPALLDGGIRRGTDMFKALAFGAHAVLIGLFMVWLQRGNPESKMDISWLKSITKSPILIKGVLTREDGIKAVEVGVEGIIVSNHGGRQLNAVVFAVQGRIPVLLDAGIRRGTDIFKALALGAHAVLIGLPIIYGLAAKGEYGVRRVIEMLRDELELTMALSGCSTLNDITRNHVRPQNDDHHCRL